MVSLPRPIITALVPIREAAFRKIFQVDRHEVLNPVKSDVSERLGSEGLIEELLTAIHQIKLAAIDGKGNRVDYSLLRNSQLYEDFINQTMPKLQDLSLSELGGGNMATSFWINVYNALTMHAVIAFDVKKSLMRNGYFEFMRFFLQAAYQVGGYRFSLDDIEHGILRGNRGNPHFHVSQFHSRDERNKFVVGAVDARIHFALNCASQSCPPIRVYSPDKLDVELDLATRNFIDQEVSLEDGVMYISQIFKWYQVDFGGKKGVIEFLCKHLPIDDERWKWLKKFEKNAKIKYVDYDWGLND